MSDKSKVVAIERHIEELSGAEQIISDAFVRMEKDHRFNLDFEMRSNLEESRYQIRKVLSKLREMKIEISKKGSK